MLNRRRSPIETSDDGRRTLERHEQQLGDQIAAVVTASFTAAELACLRAAAPLLARTTWAAARTDGSGEVMLESSFLLRRDGDRLRVIVYMTHQGRGS